MKVTQLSQQVSGRGKWLRAHTDTIIATIRTDHHLLMQELQEKQNQEIRSRQSTSVETVTALENLSVQAIAKKTGAIDDVLNQMQIQYSKLQATTGAAEHEINADSMRDVESPQELEFSQQEQLEAVIQSRNEDC
jgi:hypothetical protein